MLKTYNSLSFMEKDARDLLTEEYGYSDSDVSNNVDFGSNTIKLNVINKQDNIEIDILLNYRIFQAHRIQAEFNFKLNITVIGENKIKIEQY